MNTTTPRTPLAPYALASLLALAAAGALGQGALTPIGGPAPTMKSLAQLEPRTPITSLPYVIAEPGSYYLMGPLATTNAGITISANYVTLDLMGFTISGNLNASHKGIHVAGGSDVLLRNIVIRNGGVTQFGEGVRIDNAVCGALTSLHVQQNAGVGIGLYGTAPGRCSDFTVEECVVADNGGAGISVTTFDYGSNSSHTIRHNKISGNREHGVYLIRATGCLVDSNHFGPQVNVSNVCFAVRSGLGRNIVVRNFEYGNAANFIGVAYFTVSGSDTFGPIVDLTGTLSSTNKESHAWANFTR